MLKPIWGLETERNYELMEAIWRFRHRQFVDRLDWKELRQPDGREIDDFDTPDAIHLPLLSDGEVLGYSRLLPTNAPHLLSDVYPEIMDGKDWPRGPTIYEWTRCIASEKNVLIEGVSASNILLTGVLEYCLLVGITSLIVETHPKLVNLLVSNDWDVTPLSAPTHHKGHLVLPIDARPSLKALMKHHEAHRINGSVVDLHGDELNPLDRVSGVRRLAYLGALHSDTSRQDAVALRRTA
jgi:acyl-homoserine lactone synthase